MVGPESLKDAVVAVIYEPSSKSTPYIPLNL